VTPCKWCGRIPMCCLHLHFTLKMEAAWSSKTLVCYWNTTHHNPEAINLGAVPCYKS